MSAYAKLRRRRQLFVDAYVETGVGVEACKRSGYGGKNPDVMAAKMLANPEVKLAVIERQEQAIAKAGVRIVRVLEEAALVSFASIAMLRHADGKPKAFKDLPPELLTGAQSIEFNPDGTVKNLRLAKMDGLKFLGQYLKLLTEVHEVAGKGGGPIETKSSVEITDLEKARRIAHLLAQGLRARPASVLDDSGEPEPVPPNPDGESDPVV